MCDGDGVREVVTAVAITPSVISCGVRTRSGNGGSGRSSHGTATAAASAASAARAQVQECGLGKNEGWGARTRAGVQERVPGCMPRFFFTFTYVFS